MDENYIFLVDQLKDEYRNTFQKIELYADVHYIDIQSQNEMLMDLIDLFLTAQEKQTPIEKIIGKDLEKFCQSFFGEYQGKKRFLTLLNMCYRLAWIMLAIEFFSLPDGEHVLFQTSDISGYFTGIAGAMIASLLLSLLIKPFLFRAKKLTSGIFAFFTIVFSLALSFGFMALVGENTFEVPIWCTFATAGTYILIYIIVRAYFRYRDHGTIWKTKDYKPFGFFRKLNQDISPQIPFELEKNFLKKNERRAKKGKPLMTEEAFLKYLERDIKTGKYCSMILIPLLLIFLLFIIIRIFMEDGFLDGLIFTAILTVAELPAVFIFWASFNGVKEKRKIVSTCQSRNITFSEYMVELKEVTSEKE